MRNDEIMTLKLERIKVIDLEMAINSIIFDFEAEIHAPKTSDDRRKIAKSAIDHRWKPFRISLKIRIGKVVTATINRASSCER